MLEKDNDVNVGPAQLTLDAVDSEWNNGKRCHIESRGSPGLKSKRGGTWSCDKRQAHQERHSRFSVDRRLGTGHNVNFTKNINHSYFSVGFRGLVGSVLKHCFSSHNNNTKQHQ